ncbi:MAG: GNAT family N-acetyltransferase [Burkholderiales bacterium]|nr:GNAT family N-acetyltransferase [Burkholderiales bacterium]
MASKMHWGYSAAQMAVLRPRLRVLPVHLTAQMSVQSAFVGVLAGEVIGFHSLLVDGQACELDNLWLLPAHIGRGFGRQLLAHACAHAAAHGWRALSVDADPFAAPFYLHCGARQVGQTPAPLPDLPHRARPQLLLAVPLAACGGLARA